MKKGIIGVLSGVLGAAVGASSSMYFANKTVNEKACKVNKFKAYYTMLNQWLALKQSGHNLCEYFDKYNYKKIALYGVGELGNRIYEELKDTDIKILYAIDQNASSTYSDLDVTRLEECSFEEVDVIVVTAVFAVDDIESKLSEKTHYPIVSLEDIVFEI